MMDATALDIQPVSVVEAVTRGEIDVQISTAKRYPRDIEASRNAATAMACVDEETAASCMYALPRAGKKIEGGSIRLAEIVASTYGNLRVQSRIIDDQSDKNYVTAMAGAWDLQSNTAVSIEKKRRATDRNGKRYNDDMMITTQNANASIAFRDAVFKVVPRAFWQPIYEAARNVAIGNAATLGERRSKLVEYFGKLGVFEDRLLASFGYESTDQIGLDDLGKLLGTANLIKEGQTTVDQAFPPAAKESASLADKIKAKQQPQPEQAKADDPAVTDATNGTGASEPVDGDVLDLRKQINDAAKAWGSTAKTLAILQKYGVKSQLALADCVDVKTLAAILQGVRDGMDE